MSLFLQELAQDCEKSVSYDKDGLTLQTCTASLYEEHLNKAHGTQ